MAKKLYRSGKDKIIGGICGGLAEYFDIDSTLVRLAALVLLVIANGGVVLAYIIGWIIIPEKAGGVIGKGFPFDESEEDKKKIYIEKDNDEKQKVLGFILLILGFVFLIDNLFPFFAWGSLWPIILIIIGLVIILKGVKGHG